MNHLELAIGIISALAGAVAVVAYPGRWLINAFSHWQRDLITEIVTPFLTNSDKTVANYAHDAAEAAHSAQEAAQAARDAAYESRRASLEARDAIREIRDQMRG